MTTSVPDILARIVEYKRAELAGVMIRREELEKLAAETHRKPRDFRAALKAHKPAIIAEIKKASPSKGILANHADPQDLARAYEQGGAAALSVLTDEKFFHGTLEDLAMARGAVRLPVLRKDFMLDDYHVAESAAGCADAILLIAAILPSKRLRHLREYAAKFGIASIVEVHNEEELAQALDSGAEIIGVNNRDMRTFEVKIETSLRMAEHIPAGILKISESGIRSSEDVKTLRAAGYEAFLVGEHLMRSHQPAEAVKALVK